MMRPRVVLGLLLATVIAGVVTGVMLLPDEAPETAVGPPAGDRPNPLGNRETTSTSRPGRETTSPSGPDEQTTTSQPTNDSSLERCFDLFATIEVGQIRPLYAVGEVSGLGPGASYMAIECGGLSPSPGQRSALEGGCFFAQSWLPTLLELVESFQSREDVKAAHLPGIRETVFQASFRLGRYEYLSIAGDGGAGIVTGGYSVGGDGSRGSGQEWPIGGGDQFLRYGVKPPQGSLWDNLPTFNGVAVVPFTLTAEWAGESTENWTGEKAFGKVTVSCTYVIGVDAANLADSDGNE